MRSFRTELAEALAIPFDLHCQMLTNGLAGVGGKGCSASSGGGVLTVDAAPRTDLFLDPRGTRDDPQPDVEGFVGTPPHADFQLSARVTVQFRSTFDAGVLLVHAEDSVWAKLCFEYTPQGRPSVVSVVTRGRSDDANAFELEEFEYSVWLRITRTGGAFAFHASTDGEWWRLIRYFTLGEAGRSARVGFMAQSPTGEGCIADFDSVTYVAEAPKDLRDGS